MLPKIYKIKINSKNINIGEHSLNSRIKLFYIIHAQHKIVSRENNDYQDLVLLMENNLETNDIYIYQNYMEMH